MSAFAIRFLFAKAIALLLLWYAIFAFISFSFPFFTIVCLGLFRCVCVLGALEGILSLARTLSHFCVRGRWCGDVEVCGMALPMPRAAYVVEIVVFPFKN